MKPVASFAKSISGLVVAFTDTSSNLPTSWSWNFGDATTSTSQNPIHTYLADGVYTVVLTSTNASGSNTIISTVLVSTSPVLNLSIEDMVNSELPPGLPIANNIQNIIQKWQLYLQPLVNPSGIPDLYIFTEIKWPPLVNILISKLVIYDLILTSAKAALINYQSTSTTQTSTPLTQVCDYEAAHGLTAPFTLTNVSILISGTSYSAPGPITSLSDLKTWVNSLGLISLQYTNSLLFSTHTEKIVESITFNSGAGNIVRPFTQTNCILTQVLTTTNSTNQSQGVKYIETGPSKVEWFNVGEFWDKMFRITGNDPESGVFGAIIKEACSLAARVGISLPMCKALKTDVPLFIIGGVKLSPFTESGIWRYCSVVPLFNHPYASSPLPRYPDAPLEVVFTSQLQVPVLHNLQRAPLVEVLDQFGIPMSSPFVVDQQTVNLFLVSFLTPTSGKILYR